MKHIFKSVDDVLMTITSLSLDYNNIHGYSVINMFSFMQNLFDQIVDKIKNLFHSLPVICLLTKLFYYSIYLRKQIKW